MRPITAFALLALLPRFAAADGLTVLTVAKSFAFKGNRGIVRVGRDPLLAMPPAPTCPATSAVELSAYPEPSQRVLVATRVVLDCTKWRARRKGFTYTDPAATGGVRSIRYGRAGLRIRFQGVTMPSGPVGYAQAWLEVDATRFNARVHNFKRNRPGNLVSRAPSEAAATGERAFWALLHHDWDTPDEKAALEATALDCFRQATRADRRDARSRFLLAMTHLYRFGQAVDRYETVSDFAGDEIESSHAAFQQALPLLWDGTVGDSRVPGFAAAATFGLGVVRRDHAMQDQGLAALNEAIRINPFFNVFDYLPVLQALPAFDPRFRAAFDQVNAYLTDPATMACVSQQPELCADAGYAPANSIGALTLFGDMNAKVGDAAAAQQWYALALGAASARPTPYRFLPALQERATTVSQRVALYGDADATNDPTVIGARAEACAACHAR